MKADHSAVAKQVLDHARHSLAQHHMPRIMRCLAMLSEKEIWWRAHRTSNSVGNLVLHLSGNVRQWMISALGGAPDQRQRDREFAARGPIPRRVLATSLRSTVLEASRVLGRLTTRDLSREYVIQGFRVTGLKAVAHVTEHFAFHTGQIIYATKLLRRRDLRFTRLPGKRRKTSARRKLPTL